MTSTPLLWIETQDELRNSRFEAVSHVGADARWIVRARLEEDRAWWRISHDCLADPAIDPSVTDLTGHRFDTPDEAKAACLHQETILGGADLAPKVPLPDPDDAPPLAVDEHGYCPTREIVPVFSRNDGVLYISRVWAKPEDPTQRIEKRLDGDEYAVALESVITQHMVQTLIATITRPDGWIVALIWETLGIGKVRLECEVHFAQVRGLFRTPKPGESTIELKAPSHAHICSIVGEHLSRQRDKFEKTLATTTEAELQRQIAVNARALGINSPMPVRAEQQQGVIPVELEDMQAGGVDLEGKAFREPKP